VSEKDEVNGLLLKYFTEVHRTFFDEVRYSYQEAVMISERLDKQLLNSLNKLGNRRYTSDEVEKLKHDYDSTGIANRVSQDVFSEYHPGYYRKRGRR